MSDIKGFQLKDRIYDGDDYYIVKAKRDIDDKIVLIKLLKNKYPSKLELNKLRQEYQLAKKINVKSNLNYLSFIEDGYSNGIVIENIELITLKNYLFKNNPDISTKLKIALLIIKAIGNLHQNKVIHKNINSNNILMNFVNSENFEIKIVDFSIAQIIEKHLQAIVNPEMIEGDLNYISPEQTGRMNRFIDYRTDYYSYGIVLYKLFSGKLPFESEDSLELVHCQIAKKPESVSDINPDIPKVLSRIIMKLIEKNSDNRYQSVIGIKFDLENCLKQLNEKGYIEEFEIGEKDYSGKLQIAQKLFGRDKEIEILINTFERINKTGTSELMLISGLSGVGKSSLVNELYKPVTEKKGIFLSGKYEPNHRNIPYYAFIQSFDKLVNHILTEKDQQLKQWKEKIQNAVGDNGQVLINVIPRIELVIGKQKPVEQVNAQYAQNRFNLIMQKFIDSIAVKDNPFVIFLDDLQWIDSASLDLLCSLSEKGHNRYLFIIGAYRDNEVDKSHPLFIKLNEIKTSTVLTDDIKLNNLKLKDIYDLIFNSLDLNEDSIKYLSELIFKKTEGNPFFVNNFLIMLYHEHLIYFNEEDKIWGLDIEKIQQKNITKNVLDLMTDKINELPNGTKNILKKASCLGDIFDLNIIAMINNLTEYEALKELWPAITEQIIIPLDENYNLIALEDTETKSSKNNEEVVFRFSHDKVKKSVYMMIPQKEVNSFHLNIGRTILENVEDIEQQDEFFNIVNQMNHGFEYIKDRKEKLVLADLNLKAGRKAKSLAAYELALTYFKNGLNLLEESDWSNEYDLIFNLHKESIEAEYLNNNFSESEKLINISFEKVDFIYDKIEIYRLLIVLYSVMSKYKDAIRIGVEALKLLGVFMPEENVEEEIIKEISESKRNLGDREVLFLVNADEINEPKIRGVMNLLLSINAPAFMSGDKLYPVSIIKMANLSLKYGNMPESSKAYTTYAHILGSATGEYELGYQFCLLGMKLSYKYNAYRSKCCCMYSAFINHWNRHIKETKKIAVEGYQAGLESGDFQYAGYNIIPIYFNFFYQDQDVNNLLLEINNYQDFCLRTNNYYVYDLGVGINNIIYNLIGETKDKLEFDSRVIDEEKFMNDCIKNKSFMALSTYKICKSMTYFMFGKTKKALDLLLEVQDGQVYFRSMFVQAIYIFYHSLYMAEVCRVESEKINTYKSVIIENQKQMKKWADNCSENFSHKYYLIEAQIAWIEKREYDAINFFNRSISLSKENGFLQEQAVANELAGKYWFEQRNDNYANLHFADAFYCYQRIGYTRKVQDLKDEYPELLNLKYNNFSIAGSKDLKITSEQLDIETIIKSTLAISKEIVSDKLFVKIMHIIIENSGAQKGSLISCRRDGLFVEALADVDSKVSRVPGIPIDNFDHAFRSVINYAVRSGENVIIDNASSHNEYFKEDYIKKNKIKSILCIPYKYKKQLYGLLYLENNLVTNAFTKNRIEFLNILLTQAAISLENSMMFERIMRIEAETARAKAYLESSLESSLYGVILIDKDMKFSYINKTFLSWLGRDANVFIGKNILELEYPFCDEKTTNLLSERIKRRVVTGEKIKNAEIDIIGVNGDKRPVSYSATGIRDSNDNVIGEVVFLEDITEQKIMEKRNRKFIKDLEKKNEELERFTYTVSHDLKSPIITIKGFIGKLKKDIENGKFNKLDRTFDFISNAADKMNGLLKDLLELSRVGRTENKFTIVSIDSLINDVLDILSSQIESKKVKIIKAAKLPDVKGDYYRLVEVFQNLIDNAIKFIIDKKKPVIEIGIKQTSTENIFFVKDNGLGIKPDYHNKIFGLFHQLNQDIDGSGVGLTLVKRIIQIHKGRIWVESKGLGYGSTFFVAFPLIK